jgi:solute carrier family 35 protein C2
VVALTFFNKWFLSTSAVHFHFPLSVTCAQQFFVFLLTAACEHLFLKKLAGPIVKDWSYIYLIGPIGVMCAFDWGISNLSIQLINVSLYEMIKGSTPLFVLVLSFVTGLQYPSGILLLSLACIAVGTYLAICGIDGVDKVLTSGFPVFGSMLCLTGAFFSGARSVFTQFIMQHWIDPFTGASTINAITAVYYVAPATSASLLLPIFYFELPRIVKWYTTAAQGVVAWTFVELFGSAVAAFCVTISTFMLTKKTSALTYSVVQIGERVTIVALAMVTFGDHVGIWNAVGFGATLTGIALYHHSKMHPREKRVSFVVDGEENEEGSEDAPVASPSIGRRPSLSSVAALAGIEHRPIAQHDAGSGAEGAPVRRRSSVLIQGAPRHYGTVESGP